MSCRLLFKEKQLRLCVVAALTSMSAPVAEGLLLPPRPLASNISWSCQSGIPDDWLCLGNRTKNHKSNPDIQYAKRTANEPIKPQLLMTDSVNDTYNPITATSSSSKSVAVLLDSPKNHYVLQWMAAKERGQLEALKQRYPVLSDATIAQYKRSGKVWYVLLDGPYPSRIAAMQELEAPPRSDMARELYPWTRSLASLQKLDIIQPNYPSQQLADSYQREYQPEPSIREIDNDLVNYDISYNTEQGSRLTHYQDTHYSRHVKQNDTRANHRDSYISEKRSQNERRSADTESVPYGSEFHSNAYSSYEHNQSYRALPEQANPQEMYVSITPAYRSKIPQQHAAPREVDYNIQNIDLKEPSNYRENSIYNEPEQTQPLMNVLTANPSSYTIEWMNASRKASLERAKLRYSELQNTQIIHYKKKSRNRYALVSMLFVNRSDALDALLTPSLSRVSARFSPKVRQVAYLQSLVGSTPQSSHAWARPRIEPSIHKRRWIGQDEPGGKTYIVNREANPSSQFSQKENFRSVPQPMVAAQTIESVENRQFTRTYQPEVSIKSVDKHQKVYSENETDLLFNSPDSSYTIQWFSSNNRNSIEKLKQRFPELASAITLHVKRNGKDWYVLVQGQFSSSQEAVLALKSPAMKNIAMLLHPWTRPVGSLKKLQIATL